MYNILHNRKWLFKYIFYNNCSMFYMTTICTSVYLFVCTDAFIKLHRCYLWWPLSIFSIHYKDHIWLMQKHRHTKMAIIYFRLIICALNYSPLHHLPLPSPLHLPHWFWCLWFVLGTWEVIFTFSHLPLYDGCLLFWRRIFHRTRHRSRCRDWQWCLPSSLGEQNGPLARQTNGLVC